MSAERFVLQQQRDLGQIVEAAFGFYFQNVRPLVTIAAVIIPLGIANAAFLETIDDAGVQGTIFPFISVAQFIVDILVAAALIAALQEIDAGRPPVFARAYGVALSRFWTAVGAILRVGFHVLLFAITIVGIPWAIQRAVRWLFVLQAVILDGTSARAALSYSADAVIARWWRTLGIVILLWIITVGPASAVSGVLFLGPVLISGTASAVITAAILPLGVIAMTLLYLDLKERRETDVSV